MNEKNKVLYGMLICLQYGDESMLEDFDCDFHNMSKEDLINVSNENIENYGLEECEEDFSSLKELYSLSDLQQRFNKDLF